MKDTILRKLSIESPSPKDIFAKMLRTTADCSLACNPLPVKWISFKGERANDSTCILHWETSNEANNKGFDVERSLGNSTRFIKVGFVAASTSADALLKYSFLDGNDFSGTSFYRLRQVDKDNRFEYSKVIAIKGLSKQEAFELYPNPASDQLTLSVFLLRSGYTKLELFDANGRLLKQEEKSLAKGYNFINWDLDKISAGTYFIRATTSALQTFSQRFIKN